MPTKIVTGRSNPKNGLINEQDLKRIIQDFENFVEIKSTMAREFKKITTVSIPVPIIQNLLNPLSDLEKQNSKVLLKFGITLPDQKDCLDETIDVSNHLTAVVFVELNGIDLKDQVGDFIITPGFKEFSINGGGEGACCPVIHNG